jgi:glycosyltransferase involved in cell wall biosynthesis
MLKGFDSLGPTISFLIPVYNAERYLLSTLNSILNQDDGTIEIICVNDGSTDSSYEILQRIASSHQCVKVYNQINSGITATRNKALSHASGKWVCFVDNDDIVARGAVTAIHNSIEDHCDIVYFDFERFTGSLPEERHQKIGNKSYMSGKEVTKLQADCINRFKDNKPLISHQVLPTPWAKVYRRNFLLEHNLIFRNEVTHEEDIVFNFEVLAYVSLVKKVNFTLYYYRWSVSSESHRYRPHIFESVKQTLEAYQEVISKCYVGRADIAELYRYRVLWELQYCIYLDPMHAKNPGSYSQRHKQFKNILSYPPFLDTLNVVSTCRFETQQSVLATLIKYRQFWLLNILGKFADKLR